MTIESEGAREIAAEYDGRSSRVAVTIGFAMRE